MPIPAAPVAVPIEGLLLAGLTPALERELLPRLKAALAEIPMPEYASLPRVPSPTLTPTEVGDPWVRDDTFGLFYVYEPL